MKTNALSVYIKRKQVAVDAEGMLDPTSTKNLLFIRRHGGLKKTPEAKKAAAATPRRKREKDEERDPLLDEDEEIGEEDEPDNSIGGIMSEIRADKEYKHWRALKNKGAVELAELEIAKKKGEYMAADLVKSLFRQHNQSVLMEMKNMIDAELRYMAKQFDMPLDKVAEIKGRLIKALNDATDEAKKTTTRSIENIINDYIGLR
jgi:hypothetical protein